MSALAQKCHESLTPQGFLYPSLHGSLFRSVSYTHLGFLIASYLQIPVLGIACIAILIALLVIMNDRKKNNVEMGGMDDNEF